jgi:tetratricopeptide (TPR) repeat protein
LLAGCSGAVVQQRMPSQDAVAEAERLLDAQQPAEVVALVARSRQHGAVAPELAAAEIRALWLLGRSQDARRAEDTLARLARAAAATHPARAAARNLVEWHGRSRKNPEDAYRLLAALEPAGCISRESCKLARRVTSAVAQPVPDFGAKALRVAPPWDAPPSHGPQGLPQRLPWLQQLVEELHADGRRIEASFVVGAALNERPAEPVLWHTLYLMARAVAGSEPRSQWLGQLAAAQLSADDLIAVALQLEQATERLTAVDRTMVAQVLALARPEAGERVLVLRAGALVRADDRAGLARLAQDHGDRFASAAARTTLARMLLLAGHVEQAEPIVRALAEQQPDDAVTKVLAAELQRQRGDLAGARAAAERAVQRAADRDRVALVLAGLWRLPLPADADGWLTLAADTQGPAQLAAQRQRALRALANTRPTNREAQAVVRYARALATAAATTTTDLADDPEPAPATARRTLVRLLESVQRGPYGIGGGATSWRDVLPDVLEAFADAGVAEPEMLRQLGLHRLRTGDPAGFLDLDARARAGADDQGAALPDEPVLRALIDGDRGPALARWLHASQVSDVDAASLQWDVAVRLLQSGHAGLGRRWATRAFERHPAGDVGDLALQVMVVHGAADVAEAVLKARAQSDDVGTFAQRSIRLATALVQQDRAAEAEAVLLALAKRPDMAARHLRQPLETAADLGLCNVVDVLAPRLAADSDLFSANTAWQRSVACAREQQRDDALKPVLEALQRHPDLSRLDRFARELSQRGFDELAVAAFDHLQRFRPLNEDSLEAWARSLLVLKRYDDAETVLQRRIQLVRGRSPRVFDRAAELLEDFGQFAAATPYRAQAVAVDPDNVLWRLRHLANLLRVGRAEGLADHVQAFAKLGPGQEDVGNLYAIAERTGQLRALHAALATLGDADREVERFRMDLAAQLGERDAVRAGVRRWRAKGLVPPGRAADWLVQVGAVRDAREVAEDLLAAPESAGAQTERAATLQTALRIQRDPTSAGESLNLARLYTGRALDPGKAASDAARQLALGGLVKEAHAIAQLADDRDKPIGKLAIAELALQAGDAAAAKAACEQAFAATLLEPRLRDSLKGYRAPFDPKAWLTDDTYKVLVRAAETLADLGESEVLLRWLDEFGRIAPESVFLVHRILLAHLAAGRPQDGVQALRDAAHRLPALPDDLENAAARAVREGGARTALEWLADDGESLRTVPWLVALADRLVADFDAVPGPRSEADVALGKRLQPVRALLATLPRTQAGQRARLAAEAAGRGEAALALQRIGRSPFAGSEVLDDDLRQPAAVAAAAVLLANAKKPAGAHDVDATADHWLAHAHGHDSLDALAGELVRQGQPDLAQRVLRLRPPRRFHGVQPEALRPRLFAALAGGSDDEVVAVGTQFLIGRRGQIEVPRDLRPGSSVDELMTQMVRAGRIGAARQMAAALRRDEPSLQPLPLADDTSAVQGSVGLARFDAKLLGPLAEDAAMTDDDVERGLALRAVADPKLALLFAMQRANTADEAWRVWLALVAQAVAFEEPELARTALHRAVETGAPPGVVACPRLWLERTGTLAACTRGRAPAALDESELGDVAAALALGLDSSGAEAWRKALAAATVSVQARFLSAAAARVAMLDNGARDTLRREVEALLAAIAHPVARDAVQVQALDDLATLGLGERGAATCKRWYDADPEGRGNRNNLAYALLLAGAAPSVVLELARKAAVRTGGDPADAVTDTVAAALWQAGERTQALAMQKRALAAALTVPTLQRRAGLTQVRLAEFLLAAGQRDEARLLAAAVLEPALVNRPDEREEEPSTQQRARRVVKAVVRAERNSSPGPVTQP